MLLLNGKTDATLKALSSLKLTEYESKAYFTMLVAGECKPKEIVRLAGIPQSKIYWVIQDLVEKKMAVQTQAKPLKAKPVGLEIVLAQLKAEKDIKAQAVLPRREAALKIFLSSSCIGIFSSPTVASSFLLEILIRWSIVIPLNAIQFFIGLTLFDM